MCIRDSPDGDALGSSLALSRFLKKIGHNVNTIIPDAIPSFYKWMPGIDDSYIFDNDHELCDSLISDSDIFIATDFNSLTRNLKMSCSTQSIKAFSIDVYKRQRSNSSSSSSSLRGRFSPM